MAVRLRLLVEPVIALFMFSYIMSVIYSYGLYQADEMLVIAQNESLVRHCLYHKQESICQNLSANATDPVSQLNTLFSVESGLTGIVSSLIIGYISDRVPRTPLIAFAIIGHTIVVTAQLVNSIFLFMPVWIFYIVNLVYACFGGFGIFTAGAMAYVSDTSEKVNRTTRIVIADSMLQIGALFGGAIAGFLMSHSTWYSTPLFCVCINVFLLMYVVIFMKNPPQTKGPSAESFIEMCKGTVNVYTASGPNKARLVTLSFAYLLHITAFIACVGFYVSYLLNEPFNWSADKIGITSIVGSIANVLFLLTVPLLKMIGMTEPLIASLSCLLCALAFMGATLAKTFVEIILVTLLKSCSSIAIAIYRSRLSKMVKRAQFGQLFALLNSFESFALLVASVGVYQLYIYSRKWFNGCAFIVLVVLELAALVLSLLEGWLASRQEASDESEETDEAMLIVPDEKESYNEALDPRSGTVNIN